MKSESTKAKEISKETKQKVWERQNGKSLFAPYKPISVEMCCCHFVSRGGNNRHGRTVSGGIGEEWNIFGCYQVGNDNEHTRFDEGKSVNNLTNEEAIIVVENHLKRNYIGWELDKCSYHKGWEKEDYGIKENY